MLFRKECEIGFLRNELDFCENYAASHGITMPQAFLFGPNGSAKQAFSKWRTEEALLGQHRGSYKPENEQMAQAYDKATANTYRLPEVKNENGEQVSIDISEDKNNLPEGLEGRIVNAFNREPQLYNGKWYRGTNRLKGHLS